MTQKQITSEHLYKKLQTLPEKIGVYTFLDESGSVIYVGKSINIKKRVQSYFNSRVCDRKKTKILSKNFHDIMVYKTGTELEALILEDELIKKYMPEFNIKQKEFKEYQYIVVTNDPFPSLITVPKPSQDKEGLVFGPFKDTYLTEKIKDIVCEIFLVRYCTTKEPKNKCIRFDLGQCSGPCKGNISESAYSKFVTSALDFLHGNLKSIKTIINQKIEVHAVKLEFEQAALWRDRLRFCAGFCRRQKFISHFIRHVLVIEEESKPLRKYVFNRGVLKKVYIRKPNEDQFSKFIELLQKKPSKQSNDSVFLLDRAIVVYSWLRSRKSKKDHYFIL